jgi:hypothetical protein
MARKKQASFKMKGHTLPGINQKSETANIKDGRSPSSAFQMKESGDSPLDINFKNVLGAFNPIKQGKNLINSTKSLLQGDVKGAVGALNPFGGGGGDAGGGAGNALKDEVKAELKEEIAQG